MQNSFSLKEITDFLNESFEVRFPTGSGYTLTFSKDVDLKNQSLLFEDIPKALKNGTLKNISTFATICVPVRYVAKHLVQVYVVIYKNIDKKPTNPYRVYSESPDSKLFSTLEKEAGITVINQGKKPYEQFASLVLPDNQIEGKHHEKIAFAVYDFNQQSYDSFHPKQKGLQKIKEGGWVSITILRKILWENHKKWVLDPLLKQIGSEGILPKIRNSSD